tara:strand:+ start:254 stop:391 length:138 start_codon:yes stop_codon:yes gene_type:complete
MPRKNGKFARRGTLAPKTYATQSTEEDENTKKRRELMKKYEKTDN